MESVTTRRRDFPACDGLRALAALSVLVFHAAFLTGFSKRSGAGPYLFQLDVGVDIFFVLSGFLLYRPFVRAHVDGTEPPRVGRYLKRRFLRIFPAYWLVLLAVLYMFHQASAPGPRDRLTYFGLIQIYDHWRVLGGLVPAWSLCTEISFYAFLPLYAWVLRTLTSARSRLRAEFVGVGVLYVASCVFRIVTSSQKYDLANDWLPSYLDVFALGMLLAVVTVAVERGMVGRWWDLVPRHAAVWWAAAAALFVAASNMNMPQSLVTLSVQKYFAHHLLAGTMGALIVCPAVLHDTAGGRIRAFLASPVMRSIGLISYGIFLWHLPLMTQVVKWMGQKPFFADFWSVLLWGVPLTFAAAWVTYVFVERPLMKTRAGRREPPLGIVTAPSTAR
jgi:peptidoglycan/LPS O-acetylase OafA/YrhL